MSEINQNTNTAIMPEGAKLSAEEMREIDHEIQIVPYKKAAVIEALKIVQQHRGWISDDSVEAIGDYLAMSPA